MEEWKFYKEVTSKSRWGHRVYEVSNFGRAKLNGELLEFDDSKPGYYRIAGYYLHRIVAELFIPNPDNKPYIDHIDTNPHNNRVDNLRWVTQKENMNNILTKKKFSDTRKGKTKGVENPFYGKHHSSETRKRLSESHKGKHLSEETRKKLSEVLKGKTSGTKGKHWKLENGKKIYY